MSASQSRPWPTEIRIKRGERVLEVDFDSGERFALPAEYLRVESPSAEVQGHGAGPKATVPGKADVAIDAADPVGHYAVRLRFSDGHDTGLYSWDTLHTLGREYETRWADYLARLTEKGLSRAP
jgi:DUF971 family protein